MFKMLTGWKDVYQFTLTQKMKGKGFKITTVILLLIALFILPILSFFTEEKEETSIDSVVILIELNDVDKEKFILDLNEISQINDLYKTVKYEETTLSYDQIKTEVKEADDQYKKIAISISYTQMGVNLQYLYGKNTGVSESDVNAYANFLTKQIPNLLVKNLDITNEQMNYINLPVVKEVIVGEKINGEGTVPLSMPLYMLGCFIFAIFAFILSINAESITTSIITEKSSRVIEYIMISIKPMAIVVGKVLANLTITFLEIIIVVLGVICSLIFSPTGFPKWLEDFIVETKLNEVEIWSILLSILILILGFLLYSIISALLGATVSKIEEATEATKIYMTLMFIGIYMSIGLIVMQMIGLDVGVYEKIVMLLPFSAAVALPFYILIGKVSMIIVFISLVLMLISLIGVTLFVARVYGYIIYHNGSPIKIKELFKLSKQLKTGGKQL